MQFEKAIQALCDARVDFVVIGGVSATLHGSSRVTYDLNICYSRASSNLKRLTAALAPFHPRPRGFPKDIPFLWDEITPHNCTAFTLQTELGEIDLLAEITGLGSYDDVKPRSMIVEAYDRQVSTLDLRSLIRAKRAAGREKDLSDLAEIESLLEAREP